MSALHQMSELAREIDSRARFELDGMNDRLYEGRMRVEEATNAYRSLVGSAIQHHMREELAPYHRWAGNLLMLRTSLDAPELPPALREAIDTVAAKWHAVAAELLGPPLWTTRTASAAPPPTWQPAPPQGPEPTEPPPEPVNPRP